MRPEFKANINAHSKAVLLTESSNFIQQTSWWCLQHISSAFVSLVSAVFCELYSQKRPMWPTSNTSNIVTLCKQNPICDKLSHIWFSLQIHIQVLAVLMKARKSFCANRHWLLECTSYINHTKHAHSSLKWASFTAAAAAAKPNEVYNPGKDTEFHTSEQQISKKSSTIL